MDREAIKELMFGGIKELMQNPKFYYHSAMGINYSRWTEEGKEAITTYMSAMGWQILESEQKELDQRAKALVIKGLKGQ